MTNNMEREINWMLKEKYFGQPNQNFYEDIKRLKKGELLDYVIGFTEFLGCRINLSRKPLIPRPETEFWVRKALDELKAQKSLKVLDIFAGSGCIGVAILRHVKNTRITLADKDEMAVEQIKINLRLNKLNGKVIQSNIFSEIKGKYDYIFANPPYIPETRKSKIQKSVLKFEPQTALFGGKDGLFYIRKFLKNAKKYLNKNGVIFMEFDSAQKKDVEKLLLKYNHEKHEFFRDQYNRWRWLRAA